MDQLQLNHQLKIEKIDEHYCLLRGTNKKVEMCFFNVIDALAYCSERNYL